MACIYCCKRKSDNKVVYVGLTTFTLDFRLNGKPFGHFILAFKKNSQAYFHKALRKYGKDSFVFEVIEEKSDKEFNSKEDMNIWLNEREKYWIDYYDTFNNGYNQTTGGHNFYHRSKENRRTISEATKEAMSKLNTKELCNPTKYMTEEEKLEWKKKIRLRTKEAMSKLNTKEICNPEYGRTKDQIVEWHKKQSNVAKYRSRLAWSNKDSRQRMIESKKNRCWVHKENERYFIKKDDLQKYLNMGFSKGHGYRTNTNGGKIWMNNGLRQCLVKKEDIKLYMNNNYVIGRIKKAGDDKCQ